MHRIAAKRAANVRVGSDSEVGRRNCRVRFPLRSGHQGAYEYAPISNYRSTNRSPGCSGHPVIFWSVCPTPLQA